MLAEALPTDDRKGDAIASGKTTARLIPISLGSGLFAGLADAALGILRWEGRPLPAEEILAPLAATSAAFALLHLLIGAALSRALAWKALALGNALAVALCLLGAGAIAELSGAGWLSPRRMIVPGALASIAGAAAYAAVARAREESVRSFWLGAPLFLLAANLFLWWLNDHPDASATEWIACILLVVLTLWSLSLFVRRLGPRRLGPMLLLSLLFLLVQASAIVAKASKNKGRESTESAAVAARPESHDHRVRHVILIVVDTLRRDALSCYSDLAPQTPHIDELARASLVFEEARSLASWTLPAVCSLLTGTPPSAHLAQRPEDVLSPEIPTIAERMRASGFTTAAFADNPLLARRGLERGFDKFVLYPRQRLSPPVGQRILRRLWRERFEERTDAAALTRLGESWIRAHSREDFFLWLHYFDPHMPYEPPRRFLPAGGAKGSVGDHFRGIHRVRTGVFSPDPEERARVRALYDAEVRFVDEQIGLLLSSLKEQGLYDDALIALTSDHGEEFWEHDGFEHGHTMFEELLAVPLLLKLPGSAQSGRIASRVGTSALAPTMLELAGIQLERAELDPHRLLGEASGEPVADQELLCAGQFRAEPRVALYFDRFKYVFFPRLEREQLYDLAADPEERSPLRFPDGPAEPLEHARSRLAAHQEEAAAIRSALGVTETGSASLDEATLIELRRLGYVE